MFSFGLGAALMYVADPRTGRRRRAMMRDRLTHTARAERRLMDKAKRDLEQRVHGVVEQIAHPTSPEVSDEVLVGRVRTVVGRATSHPGSIEVTVRNHEVTLTGPVLEHEAPGLLERVAGVPGVVRVVDRLERHRTAASIPGLQGERHAPREQVVEMWSPGPRVVGGILGVTMLGVGLRQRGTIGLALRTLGASVLARAIGNHPLRRLVGLQPIEVGIEKTLAIQAPPTLVFGLFTRIHALPRFMEHVRSVRIAGADPQLSRWEVDGPPGLPWQFEARVTRFEPDRLISWTTTPRSPLQHAGTIHFDEIEGGTRVHIQLRYCPPGGLLGHALARLFGFDPRSRMHDDLVRAKTLLEEGRTSAHHQRVELHEVATS